MAIESLEYPKRKIKLVFVDDYSTDGTFEILKGWKAKMGGRYYDALLIQERTNIPQARNLCVKHMEGKYFLFWDSDVIPPKGLLKRMVNVLETDDSIGIVGADYLYEHRGILAKLQAYKPITNKASHAVYMGFTLIRKEVFERVGGFNELLDYGEDTEFGIRVVERTDYKILRAPEPVLHFKYVDESKEFRHSFIEWLLYNFHVRGKQYVESFHKLPLLLRLRIFYYTLLPLVLASTTFLAHYMGVTWILLLFITYLLPGLFLTVRGSNIKMGVVSFFTFNIPTGVALSYGFLMCLFKKLLRR